MLTVSVDEEKHSALVIVPDDQLSLAIGKRGQNARLAVRLTGWKIDIKSLSEATELGLMEQIQQKEELPVDETFQDEFAQEMLDNQEEKETIVEEKEKYRKWSWRSHFRIWCRRLWRFWWLWRWWIQ